MSKINQNSFYAFYNYFTFLLPEVCVLYSCVRDLCNFSKCSLTAKLATRERVNFVIAVWFIYIYIHKKYKKNRIKGAIYHGWTKEVIIRKTLKEINPEVDFSLAVNPECWW